MLYCRNSGFDEYFNKILLLTSRHGVPIVGKVKVPFSPFHVLTMMLVFYPNKIKILVRALRSRDPKTFKLAYGTAVILFYFASYYSFMLCIKHRSTDPFFNIATDEFIFKHLKEDCFMLWQNDNAIIVGKHQNTLSEINLDYVKEHDIKVVRRLSGGGAVYHDMGNLNFTFTRTSDRDDDLVDFKRYTKPIIAVLQQMGINAEFSGRNDIMIDGKKFSGNAEHVFKNKVMHHGTLLFSSNMPNISGALKLNPLKYKDRAVKSIPKRVTNIQDHLKEKITVEEFADRIMDYITSNFNDCKPYQFTAEDLVKIEAIKKEKYETWEWNYGYSGNYDFTQGIKATGGLLEMNMNVSKGVIKEVKIQGDFFHVRDISEIEEALIETPHEETKIREVLSSFELEKYFKDISEDDLLAAMF